MKIKSLHKISPYEQYVPHVRLHVSDVENSGDCILGSWISIRATTRSRPWIFDMIRLLATSTWQYGQKYSVLNPTARVRCIFTWWLTVVYKSKYDWQSHRFYWWIRVKILIKTRWTLGIERRWQSINKLPLVLYIEYRDRESTSWQILIRSKVARNRNGKKQFKLTTVKLATPYQSTK